MLVLGSRATASCRNLPSAFRGIAFWSAVCSEALTSKQYP